MISLKQADRCKRIFRDADVFVFTLDVDWASDEVIRYAVEYFRERRIPITLFCTHPSDYVSSLIENHEIDYGIHPNFIQPSSQGTDRKAVVDYCMEHFPQVRSFRAHRWYADNDVYTDLAARGIRYESNLCTMLDVVAPFLHRSGMVSFPVFFEDGAYVYHDLPLNFAEAKRRFEQPGVKVLDLHPMHLLINTPYFRYMREIKDSLSREKWNHLSGAELAGYRNTKRRGIADFVEDIISFVKAGKKEVASLDQIYQRTRGEKSDD